MNEESLDLFATAIAFGLALYAWLRRHAVVSVANEEEGIEDHAA